MKKAKRRLEEFDSTSSKALVSRYRDAAAARGQALLGNDTKLANRQFDMTEQVWEELARRDALGELRVLLVDRDPGVRLAAAGKLLRVFPDAAIPVLQELSEHNTIIGMSAAGTLEAHQRYGD